MHQLHQNSAFAPPFLPFRFQTSLSFCHHRRRQPFTFIPPPCTVLPAWFTQVLSNTISKDSCPSQWGKGPPLKLITNYGPADRILAIGDIHGDVDVLKRALKLSGIIDDRNKWIGGRTVLVQVGDIVDRGAKEKESLELLFRLQDEATKTGGQVFLLLGNHEILNICGNYKYIHKDSVHAFDNGNSIQYFLNGLKEGELFKWFSKRNIWGRMKAFHGPVMKELGRRCQIAVIVGDNLFVHAGLAPHHFFGVQEIRSDEKKQNWIQILHDINLDVRRWMLKYSYTKDVLQYRPRFLRGVHSPLYARYYSRLGLTDNSPACDLLDLTLKMVGAKRMIVGHSIQVNGISPACRDKIWCIDTGMSTGFENPGAPETLEIDRKGNVRVLTENGVIDGKQRRCD